MTNEFCFSDIKFLFGFSCPLSICETFIIFLHNVYGYVVLVIALGLSTSRLSNLIMMLKLYLCYSLSWLLSVF